MRSANQMKVARCIFRNLKKIILTSNSLYNVNRRDSVERMFMNVKLANTLLIFFLYIFFTLLSKDSHLAEMSWPAFSNDLDIYSYNCSAFNSSCTNQYSNCH